MRIVFMGTPDFGVPSLEALLRSDDEVVGVVAQPDRPKGRGHQLAPPPVKLVAQAAGKPILQPTKMKDPAFLEALRAWQPDVIAVAAFGRILPAAILSLPPRGCINVHGSLLPKYRGAAPIQWAVIHGEHETGITTMLMDEGMDTGAMLLREAVSIEPTDTSGTLGERLSHVGARLLIDTLRALKANQLTPIPQDHSGATMAPIIKKEHGLIDWTMAADAIARRVRGFNPWPTAYTFLGDVRWTIWQAQPVSVASAVMAIEGTSQLTPAGVQPGTVVRATKEAILVQCGDGQLAITQLQPSGSRRMAVGDYLAGHPVSPGVQLGSPPATPPSP